MRCRRADGGGGERNGAERGQRRADTGLRSGLCRRSHASPPAATAPVANTESETAAVRLAALFYFLPTSSSGVGRRRAALGAIAARPLQLRTKSFGRSGGGERGKSNPKCQRKRRTDSPCGRLAAMGCSRSPEERPAFSAGLGPREPGARRGPRRAGTARFGLTVRSLGPSRLGIGRKEFVPAEEAGPGSAASGPRAPQSPAGVFVAQQGGVFPFRSQKGWQHPRGPRAPQTPRVPLIQRAVRGRKEPKGLRQRLARLQRTFWKGKAPWIRLDFPAMSRGGWGDGGRAGRSCWRGPTRRGRGFVPRSLLCALGHNPAGAVGFAPTPPAL